MTVTLETSEIQEMEQLLTLLKILEYQKYKYRHIPSPFTEIWLPQPTVQPTFTPLSFDDLWL